MEKNTFTIHTFGCRLNQAESSMIADSLRHAGFTDGAETSSSWHVINSCVVTNEAVRKCKQLIRKIKKNDSEAKLALVGCYPQADKSAIENEVDIVLGSNEKFKLLGYIQSWQKNNAKIVSIPRLSSKAFETENLSQPIKKTRAVLKIQDGCDFYCSFCIVPFARGHARSRKFNDIVKECAAFVEQGFKEMVISGVNIGLYNDSSYDFLSLIEHLLKTFPIKIRLSSIEPTTINEGLLYLMAENKNFAKFLHLPLQSASDSVLQSMRRKYSISEYDDYINKAKSLMPNIALGTDIIAGFPGESDEYFTQTMDYFVNSKLDFGHIFPYSIRQGTRAANMEGFIDGSTIKERAAKLRQASERKWQQFCFNQLKSTQDILFETKLENGMWQGYSDNYINVVVKENADANLQNKLLPVRLNELNSNASIIGELV